jgi:hypothetical protein
MRRNERERQARKTAYQMSQNGFWVPKDLSLEQYLAGVKSHPTIPEMLNYLSENHRDWEDESDLYRPSKDGVCEKCTVRALNLDPTSELKSTSNTGFEGAEVHFSKFIADRFAAGKEPITLTPNLHREFVYQSWIEAAHLDHIREHMDEPGLAAIEAQPELNDGALHITLSFRAIDGSHRAALTYKEGKPFAVRVLTPVETLKSTFAIGTKKNPFFVGGYTEDAELLLEQMARGEAGPNAPVK